MVKRATFLMVARHCELIFCPLISPKCDLGEVKKAMFEVAECHFEVILCYMSNRKC